MNMFKSNGGFTLVELIVVIAILAILAGVAVPAYSGYISKAQEAADIQILSSANTALGAACVEQNVKVTDLTLTFDGTAIDITKIGTVEVPATKPANETDAGYNEFVAAAAIEETFGELYTNNAEDYKYYNYFQLDGDNFKGSDEAFPTEPDANAGT